MGLTEHELGVTLEVFNVVFYTYSIWLFGGKPNVVYKPIFIFLEKNVEIYCGR
jgi:hypothetical protein